MFDDVSLSVMLATLLVFLAMMLILNSLLYKPLLKFMDERRLSIENDEQKVQQNSQEMSSFSDDLAKIRQDTRDEVALIKQKAIEQARSEAEQELESKKKEFEQKLNTFYAQLKEERKALEEELQSHLPLWKNAFSNKLKSLEG